MVLRSRPHGLGLIESHSLSALSIEIHTRKDECKNGCGPVLSARLFGTG